MAKIVKKAKKAKLGRPLEWTEERLKVEADALEEYAKLPSSLSFERFTCFRDEPYTREQLYKHVAKSDTFKYAFMRARDIIRQNREDAVASGKLHQAVYAKTCTFYDREQSLTDECLAAHHKDMDRAKRDAKKDDQIDVLKSANDAIQGLDENDN